jgi:hypothetical protein
LLISQVFTIELGYQFNLSPGHPQSIERSLKLSMIVLACFFVFSPNSGSYCNGVFSPE